MALGDIYIPALKDLSSDAVGGSIQNKGGYLHNQGPFKLKATDPVLLTKEFLSADGITFDAKSFDAMDLHANYSDLILIKCKTLNGVKYMNDMLIYNDLAEFTPAEIRRNDRWLGTCELSGGSVDLLVTDLGDYVLNNGNVVFDEGQ